MNLQLAWLYIKLRLAQLSPGLLRLVTSRDDMDTVISAVGHHLVDEAGHSRLVANLSDASPGDKVLLQVYFVAGTKRFLFGAWATLWPLSEYVYSQETAERKQREIARTFPLCAVHTTTLVFDPADPEQRAQLDACNRHMVLELMRGAR